MAMLYLAGHGNRIIGMPRGLLPQSLRSTQAGLHLTDACNDAFGRLVIVRVGQG